jgi:superfamily II DNA or RNA helicase/HKD family nuclease
MNIERALSDGIQTGFLDHRIPSAKTYQPELLTNDGNQGKKFLTTILRELEGCEEFWFSVAFVTTSGIATLINTLIELEKGQVHGRILASQYLNFTQPEALKRIKQFTNIELRISTEGSFHSKGYLFKNDNIYNLIIGSSNLTQAALCSNKEWNLKVSATQESALINQALIEFTNEFELAQEVTENYLTEYEEVWKTKSIVDNGANTKNQVSGKSKIQPNLMQREALNSIELLRSQGKNKALLISATGTGKTYLSAFDVQNHKPKKFLFVVHRRTIAEDAMNTFKELLGNEIKMGIYSGPHLEIEADYLFSTVQTISKQDHLDKFDPHHFDYIVIDETHRAGAESYKKIMSHFTPAFLLGMTATPERTDGADIFKLFGHNIAYEIRLHRALEEDMLSPFHYYGVTDLTINDEEVDEFTDFNLLTAKERVDRIVEKAELFGCDDGEIRGLVFCSRNEISQQLSFEFNQRGYKTLALTGNSEESERQKAINRLESEQLTDKLDYIFTVDIFNEGIDIPKVNQIIMLRPTQSAIVFVQQLGRGLRKTSSKEYLTVIDFIGNYDNNYLVPIALYGDTSYNKDSLRKLMAGRSSIIPGPSTINFDKISKDRIFASIDSAKMGRKKDLKLDYELLKFKLGRIPMMTDFVGHGSRDPQLYVNYSKSYFNFVAELESSIASLINSTQKKLLELFSKEINNTKRIEETLILEQLVKHGSVEISWLKAMIEERYSYETTDSTIDSCLINLNFEFVTETKDNGNKPVRDIYSLNVVRKEGAKLVLEKEFQNHLFVPIFKTFLMDSVEYAKQVYDASYAAESFIGGFKLYQKYTRKDVFRILNWRQNPVAQNVGGYMVSKDKSNCAIFVNYHKADGISSTTKYEDEFADPYIFQWMSKSSRTLNSPEVLAIKNHATGTGLRLPLFIKKSNDEGAEFYFMGDIEPINDSFEETKMLSEKGKEVSVVKIKFTMDYAVEDSMYNYLTSY